jgi:predicted RNase H-like nuclease
VVTCVVTSQARSEAARSSYVRPMGSPLVLGVDGCSKGWLGIAIGAAVTAHFGTTIGDLVQLVEDQIGRPDVVAIDIPIGLPDATIRAADRLARTMIGPRRMSVFFTPTRQALQEPDYAAAQIVNRELTGGGFSQQAWALRPKILEVDAWARSTTSSVLEVHPELSFATMAGAPLLTRKSSYAGFQQRQNLLTANGIVLPPDLGIAGDLGGVDDVLDAAAATWSARRYARGEAGSVPDPPEHLNDGIDCAIWY